jgi:hypothetical protein
MDVNMGQHSKGVFGIAFAILFLLLLFRKRFRDGG